MLINFDRSVYYQPYRPSVCVFPSHEPCSLIAVLATSFLISFFSSVCNFTVSMDAVFASVRTLITVDIAPYLSPIWAEVGAVESLPP